ncbi:hypothetical protein ACFL1A_03205 [Patescibacteria group bacterium]
MKKITLFLCAAFFFGIIAQPAEAKVINVKTGGATVAASEVIDDDLFIAGETVDIAGEVTGDVYAAGGVVTFSGKTTGDLIISGGTVNVSGDIGQDLYIAAGNATVTNANIGDTVAAGVGSLTIDKESLIGGSFLAGAGMVQNSAAVGRNAYIGAGSVTLNNSVGGEVRLGAESITLGDDVRIGKDFLYMTDKNKPDISESASVSGMIKKIVQPGMPEVETDEIRQNARRMFAGFATGFKVLSFLGALVTGLAILWFLPKTSVTLVETAEKQFGKTVLTGLIASMVTIPLVFVLLITGVGVKLAFLTSMIFIMFVSLSNIVSGFALGRYMVNQFGWKNATSYGALSLGLITLSIVSLAPYVSVFIVLVVFWFGFGVLMQGLLNARGK